jgi:rifampin ADP-ribosylating transferase
MSLHGRSTFADELDTLTDPIDPAWARDFVASFPLFHQVPSWYLEERIREAVCIPADVWRKSLAGLTESLPPTEVGTISAPTLILWGDQDELLRRADELALEDKISSSRLVEYPGVGHLVLWEQPERVAADIVSFLADLQF